MVLAVTVGVARGESALCAHGEDLTTAGGDDSASSSSSESTSRWIRGPLGSRLLLLVFLDDVVDPRFRFLDAWSLFREDFDEDSFKKLSFLVQRPGEYINAYWKLFFHFCNFIFSFSFYFH